MLRQCRSVIGVACNNFCTASRLSVKSNVEGLPKKAETEPSELAKNSVSIEKKSLSRGLALNMFEKDFMIYPEYSETDDVKSIKNYIGKLRSDIDKAVTLLDGENRDLITAQVLPLLVKHGVFSTFISKKFSGAGFNQKDLMMVSEMLGSDDLSLFLIFNQAQSAAQLISIFGTEQQKQKYLPEIAAFRCKPCICIYDEPTADGVVTEVIGVKGQKPKLNGVKINVVGAENADLFIVFAKKWIDDIKPVKCFIIERQNLGPAGSINIQEKVQTQGLNTVHISKVNFTNVTVDDEQILGFSGDIAKDMLDELRLNGKTFYGSAVVGFLKKLIDQLCDFANSRMEGNLRVADMHPVQGALSNLTIGIYVLESMVYYIAGLTDEDLFLLNDVENSIIQRYSNKVLRDAVVTVMDITGLAATNIDFPFDKVIRDSMTLISMTESDLKLVRQIALPTIETYIQKHGSMSNLMAKFTISKLFSGDYKTWNKLKNPKLTHFIAEHVHPSLELSARSLEQSMSRINQVIDHLVTDRGIYIKEDYIALRELATVLENNLGMAATIARASRSYSIGLRNCEHELNWTTYYCSLVAKQTENILQEVVNHFGIVSFNPKLTVIGQCVLENNGYCIESPVERNW